ncbi:hypothetical protein DFQ26_009452 [Actinomortierella ambigua]|nr:hypothetical protein DFQ26_009452 [Actinomortierella ambigua]
MNISRNSQLQVDFGRLVNNETKSDIKFIIGRDEAVRYGHSAILSAHWKEASEGVFRKPNIEPEVFDVILQYLYTGEVKAPLDVIPQLIEAALELQLGEVVSGCEELACQAFTRETVFQIIATSFRHDLSELQSKVLEFFDVNAQSLIDSDDLFTLEPEVLVTVLSRETADLDELDVWGIIVRYAYHRNGYDHKDCPLLQLPESPGRIIVEVVSVGEVDNQESTIMVCRPAYSTDESTLIDPGLGERPINSKDVVIILRQDQFQNLCAAIHPLLRSIRFADLDVADFARYWPHPC